MGETYKTLPEGLQKYSNAFKASLPAAVFKENTTGGSVERVIVTKGADRSQPRRTRRRT